MSFQYKNRDLHETQPVSNRFQHRTLFLLLLIFNWFYLKEKSLQTLCLRAFYVVSKFV